MYLLASRYFTSFIFNKLAFLREYHIGLYKMNCPTDRPASSCLSYHVISNTTSIYDKDTELTVRSNSKLFYVRISPSCFRNSPATTAQYLVYLDVLRSSEEEIDEVYEDDVYEWATRPFESLFAERAPAPASASVKVTLQDYLFPETFVC